jgi:hypothetical protein
MRTFNLNASASYRNRPLVLAAVLDGAIVGTGDQFGVGRALPKPK